MRTVIVGGGMMGLTTAMLLANEGHEVIVLERDAERPPEPSEAFERWERRGVNQFRLSHLFLSRFRTIVESELPELAEALLAAGALRYNIIENVPDEVKGGARTDDDRFDLITGRRAMVEAVTGRLCEEVKQVTLRRGAAVESLQTGPSDRRGVPHVTGVRLDSGEDVAADLVVDACGRRSALPKWLAAIGAAPVVEEMEDSGFVYFGRHFRSADGQMPPMLGPLKQEWGTIGVLTLPADNGTWSVTLTASSKDAELRALRHPDRWSAVAGLLPLTAHWIDAQPLDDKVAVMAKIEDRIREFAPDGNPLATGVLAIADSWSCTNPSLGRGASVGMLHAVALRDHLRAEADPAELAWGWSEITRERVEPWYRTTLDYDRHRLREIHSLLEGRAYETDDEFWRLNQAVEAASATDGERLRSVVEMGMMIRHPDEVFGDRAQRDQLLADAPVTADQPSIGPDREQLLAALRT